MIWASSAFWGSFWGSFWAWRCGFLFQSCCSLWWVRVIADNFVPIAPRHWGRWSRCIPAVFRLRSVCCWTLMKASCGTETTCHRCSASCWTNWARDWKRANSVLRIRKNGASKCVAKSLTHFGDSSRRRRRRRKSHITKRNPRKMRISNEERNVGQSFATGIAARQCDRRRYSLPPMIGSIGLRLLCLRWLEGFLQHQKKTERCAIRRSQNQPIIIVPLPNEQDGNHNSTPSSNY